MMELFQERGRGMSRNGASNDPASPLLFPSERGEGAGQRTQVNAEGELRHPSPF